MSSKPTKEILDTVAEAANRIGDKDFNLKAKKMINYWYFYLCRLYSYLDLEDVIEVNFAGSGDDGMIMPADSIGINKVEDVVDKFEYYPRNASDFPPNDYTHRYYLRVMKQEALHRGIDGSLSKGGKSFISSGLVDDHTGEYVQFGTEQGLYKLTAAKTFAPTYWGPNYTGQSMEFSIRPKSTRTMFLVNSSGDIYTSKVNVHYWRLPAPLYLDSDVPILPTSLPLELLMMRDLPEAKARRPVSKTEIQAAINECEMLDQRQARMREPIGNGGYALDFDLGQEPYGDSDGSQVQYPTLS